jgi:hypothetical protein
VYDYLINTLKSAMLVLWGESLSIVFIFIGVLPGMAYIVDYWASSQESSSTSDSPSNKILDRLLGVTDKAPKRVRGLTYILGGSVLPTLASLNTKNELQKLSFTYGYYAGCAITIIFGLIFLGLTALYISYQSSWIIFPQRNRSFHFSEALKGLAYALQEGMSRFLQRDEASQLRTSGERHRLELALCANDYDKTIKQTKKIYQFFAGFNTLIIRKIIDKEFGIENLFLFLQTLFDNVPDKLLDDSNKYRFAIYTFDKNTNAFHFVLSNQGLMDTERKHRKVPIPYNGSLAGYTLDNRESEPHFPRAYIDGKLPEGQTNPPFLRYEKPHDYQSTFVCPITPKKQLVGVGKILPEMVLCVDCVDNIYLTGEISYLRTIITAQSIAVAEAFISLQVSNGDMELWLSRQSWVKKQ